MLAIQYGKLIRELRESQGLKQEALARKANVSRAVLSALECGKGKPVQSDTIEKLLGALGAPLPELGSPDRDAARKLARLQQDLKRHERRERHLRLAVELAADEKSAPEKVARARRRVELWRRRQSCSPFYIERWSQVLAKPPRSIAREMSSLGEWEDALFQNSPWSWAWS
ncbi:MAG TPA: helix-turn-helix transcriptional regulator [Burkholderiales bacterium]